MDHFRGFIVQAVQGRDRLQFLQHISHKQQSLAFCISPSIFFIIFDTQGRSTISILSGT